jgi:thiol:disulfide interchange protein DsbD
MGPELHSFALAFAAGLLSVATPCVLPMLPITLSVLGVAKSDKRKALTLSLTYVAGIVLCFTSLGIFSALTGTLFGSFLGHPAVAVGIALLFVLLAAASFELYEVRLPSFVARRLGAPGSGGGHGRAFLMGLAAGFIAVPCIGPVLLGILAYVATEANVVAGAGLLACYALGFGLPFVLVGVLAVKLPKRGPWMRAVKSFFGLALLVTAFWFLRGAFPGLRLRADAALGLALLAAGIIAGALHLHFDGTTVQRLRKTAGILLAVAGSALAMNAVLAPKLIDWCREDGSGSCIAATCSSHRMTVIDFGAAWCPACHELETVTMADPEVRLRLRDFGLVKVDTDDSGDISDCYGVEGIPTVVVLDGNCREIGRFVGYVPPDKFLRFLDGFGR